MTATLTAPAPAPTTTLPPCVACDTPRFKAGTGARPGYRAAAPRGACSTCYRLHRVAGTLDQLGGSVFDASTYVPARERSGTFGDFQMTQSHLLTGKGSAPAATVPDVVDPMAALRGYAPTTALPVLSADDMRHARLVVCDRADDAAQARVLLASLGLVHA